MPQKVWREDKVIKKERSFTKFRKNRKFTVGYGTGYKKPEVPMIRMQGKWLEKLGFDNSAGGKPSRKDIDEGAGGTAMCEEGVLMIGLLRLMCEGMQ